MPMQRTDQGRLFAKGMQFALTLMRQDCAKAQGYSLSQQNTTGPIMRTEMPGLAFVILSACDIFH
jgi:hypothetical protein